MWIKPKIWNWIVHLADWTEEAYDGCYKRRLSSPYTTIPIHSPQKHNPSLVPIWSCCFGVWSLSEPGFCYMLGPNTLEVFFIFPNFVNWEGLKSRRWSLFPEDRLCNVWPVNIWVWSWWVENSARLLKGYTWVRGPHEGRQISFIQWMSWISVRASLSALSNADLTRQGVLLWREMLLLRCFWMVNPTLKVPAGTIIIIDYYCYFELFLELWRSLYTVLHFIL